MQYQVLYFFMFYNIFFVIYKYFCLLAPEFETDRTKIFFMRKRGNILKMRAEQGEVVHYVLPVGDEEVAMNELIGKTIKLSYQHQINCIICGRQTNKSFAQGFCYPCFKSRPEADACILHPEKCTAHEGISRDMQWAETHCLIDHYVYLAVSSGLKVGVTRHTQIPVRWIDQGAQRAIKLAQTPNRHTAGRIEVELKQHFADKTSWQRMLKNQVATGIDLVEEKQRAWELLPEELQGYIIDDDTITELNYPVTAYPNKVKSVNFDKQATCEGRLAGIKGQYLLFEGGTVLNIRKHNGYLIEIET